MEFFKAGPDFALLVELVVVVGTKVTEGNAVFENMVNCNQYGVGYREISAFFAAMRANSRILRVKVR